MRKIMLATSAAAFLAASSVAALAFEQRGVLTAVDPDAGTITLDSGVTLNLPAGFDAAQLPVGDLVQVDYDPVSKDIQEIDVVTDGSVMDPEPTED